MDRENVLDSEEIPQKITVSIGNKRVGLQIIANTAEPFEIFKLLYTDELIAI